MTVLDRARPSRSHPSAPSEVLRVLAEVLRAHAVVLRVPAEALLIPAPSARTSQRPPILWAYRRAQKRPSELAGCGRWL